MKILFVSSEVAPFSKSGGLGDVSGALPDALAALGHEVDVLTPHYGGPKFRDAADVAIHHRGVQFGVVEVHTGLQRLHREGADVIFLHHDGLYHRAGYYNDSGSDYADNPYRFGLLSRVAADLALEGGYDVVHVNDWQTALTLEYLAEHGPRRPATVITIHNLAFQGQFDAAWLPRLGISNSRYHSGVLEYYGAVNPMKGAIVVADAITTVSPSYANEICTPEFGFGLDGVLLSRKSSLTGIVNGIGPEWDPSTDPRIPARYTLESLAGKATCRAALARELELDLQAGKPLIGMVSRLTDQKGIPILGPALEALLARDEIRVAIVGTGMQEHEDALAGLAARFRGRAAFVCTYSEDLAHQVEAGADLFVMPSAFEPCGLNQMYSMKYGTPPVVHAVGGLRDTVSNFDNSENPSGTGFVFHHHTIEALQATLERAIGVFRSTGAWSRVVKNAMKQDFSWAASARRYVALYESLHPEFPHGQPAATP